MIATKQLKYFFIVLILFIPFLFLGKDSIILVADVLDSELLYKFLIKSNGFLFSFDQFQLIEQPLNGLNLFHIHSQFNLYNIPFLFFDTFNSYLINALIIRLIGFLSMLYLIRFLGLKNSIVGGLVSASYALLPIYTIYGVSIMMLPAIYVCIKRMEYDKLNFKDIFILIIYIAYSVPFTYPVICFYFLFLIIKNVKNKMSAKKLLYGFAILISTIVILKYPLILNVLLGESQRVISGSDSTTQVSLTGIIFSILNNVLLFGETHPAIFITLPLLIHLILYRNKKVIKILIIIIFICFLKAISPIISSLLKSNLIDFLFYYKILFIVPFLFYLAFIYSLRINRKIYLSIFLISISIIFNLIRNYEFSANVFNDKFVKVIFSENDLIKSYFINASLPISTSELNKYPITYNNYLSKDLFKQIESYSEIIKNKSKVAAIGIDSAILLYNGIYTTTGYFNSHDKTYNQKFNLVQSSNDIIGKNKLEISLSNYKHSDYFILDLNIKKLRDLGTEYILSSKKIKNSTEIEIEFIKKFSNNTYNFYLYKLY
jgi:hypothetical protein